jgi:spore coat polysaccharide biosynthesis predicted glycosyltransferase SpsG
MYPHLLRQAKIYLGPEYFLMAELPEVMPIRQKVYDVMITMGGSDPAGLTKRVLRTTTQNPPSYTINVVLGPFFAEHKQIYEFAGSCGLVKIYENPDNFLELLSRQDIVISAAGRTLYECAYLGRPVIVVPSIEHESIISAEFARITGSFDVGLWDELMSPAKINNALNTYILNPSLRQSVFDSSRELVDGHAMERVLSLFEL